MSEGRMMQEVPKADVVITNPTHVAVALKYNRDEMAAPEVVAKGYDAIAQKIKAIAAENGVPMVENIQLARPWRRKRRSGGRCRPSDIRRSWRCWRWCTRSGRRGEGRKIRGMPRLVD
jgi:type III secretory pathway component EscU